jgi:hypothetical protein
VKSRFKIVEKLLDVPKKKGNLVWIKQWVAPDLCIQLLSKEQHPTVIEMKETKKHSMRTK